MTAPAPAVKPGDYEETIIAGGKIRNYLLHVPPSYDGKKTPLVIVLHGGGGNAGSTAEMTGMNIKSDQAGFIAVYPNGTSRISDEKLLTWNAGNCCGYALDNNIDDVGFIRELIGKLERELSIDTARIYATGISNGGMMSYRLACELSDKIAAIAPVAGAMGMADCNPVNPVSVIIFHGTADDHVLYEGGTPRTQLDTHPRVDKPVSYAVDFWVKADGCSPAATKETKGYIVKEVYSGGRNGTGVVLYTIVGGKHAWPGGKPGWLGGDVPTREISATDLMWDFFVSHPKQLN
jgi:polyhydroxybutyrate depolymerase